MGKKIIAIDLSPKKKNVIYSTVKEARSSFIAQPHFQKKMSYNVMKKALENGTPLYERETHAPYCLDELLEIEDE